MDAGASPIAALPPAIATLLSASASLESQFLSTGNSLEQMHASGQSFVRSSERLVEIAIGRRGADEILINSVKTVQEPLKFLSDFHGETGRILEGLVVNNQRIASLLSVDATLRRTMAPLGFLQTLFKVQSAPLGDVIAQTFVSLTQELATLNTQVCALFGTKLNELKAVRDTIDGVICTLSVSQEAFGASVMRQRSEIEAALDTLQSEMSVNQTRESQIGRVSKQISTNIQKVVSGLQFQDIISQKLQHTSHTLKDLTDKLQAGEPPSPRYVNLACRLETAQIQAARDDLAAAEKTIAGGVNDVLECIREADAKFLLLADFKVVTTSATGMVQTLLDILETLDGQVQAAVDSASHSALAIKRVGDITSDLTSVVRDISYRTHLLGLNAQVQAARVPEGAALAILSSRTSEISQEIGRTSESVARELDLLGRELSGNIRALGALQARAVNHQESLAHSGEAERAKLHGLRDEALQLLQETGTSFEQIGTTARDALAGVRYVETADPAMAALQVPLQALAEAAGTKLEGSTESADETVAQLRKQYTMVSEHEVFASVVGESATANQTGGAGSVDLFEDAPVTPAGDVELFGDPAPSTSPPPQAVAPPPPAEPFGANVELF